MRNHAIIESTQAQQDSTPQSQRTPGGAVLELRPQENLWSIPHLRSTVNSVLQCLHVAASASGTQVAGSSGADAFCRAGRGELIVAISQVATAGRDFDDWI